MDYVGYVRAFGTRVTQQTRPWGEGLEAVVSAFSGFDKPVSTSYHSITHAYGRITQALSSALSHGRKLASRNGHKTISERELLTGLGQGVAEYAPRPVAPMLPKQVYLEVDKVLRRAGYGDTRLGNEIKHNGQLLGVVDPNKMLVVAKSADFHGAVSAAISELNEHGLNYRIRIV